MEEEEVKIASAKRDKMKVLLMEIEHANKMALAMKEEKKLREKEEDLAIFKHV